MFRRQAASAASDAQRRAERAVALAHLGELSAARQLLRLPRSLLPPTRHLQFFF